MRCAAALSLPHCKDHPINVLRNYIQPFALTRCRFPEDRLMEVLRKSPTQFLVLDGDGTTLAELTAQGATPEQFDALVDRLAMALGAPPARIALVFREGLLEESAADLPCELVILEEDRFDQPPAHLRRRLLEQAEPEALDAMVARLEKIAKT